MASQQPREHAKIQEPQSVEEIIAQYKAKVRARNNPALNPHIREPKLANCIKKWIEIPADKAPLYGIAALKMCVSCCKFRSSPVFINPYIVHDPEGDYTCYSCGEDCNVKFMCQICNGNLNKVLRRNNR